MISDRLRELARTDPRYAAILSALEAGKPIPSEDELAAMSDRKPNPTRIMLSRIASCIHRGPVASQGCNCTRLCWVGKGYNPDGLAYGRIKQSDCWECLKARDAAQT